MKGVQALSSAVVSVADVFFLVILVRICRQDSQLIILCRDLFLIKSLRDFAGDLDEVFFSVLLGA